MKPLRSPVTGVVFKVLVQTGTRLARGEAVMLIESMKMEIPVEMPHEGVILRVLVAENDTVNENQIVVEIE